MQLFFLHDLTQAEKKNKLSHYLIRGNKQAKVKVSFRVLP